MDIRKYPLPARGTNKWKGIIAQRTAVERVNVYLKRYFQLYSTTHRTGQKAKLHLQLVTLVYNTTKLIVDPH